MLHPARWNFLRKLLLLVSLLGLSGCTVSLTYSQLDRIIAWELRDYVRLQDEQRQLFRERLSVQLQWHCSTQMPEYGLWLQEISQSLHAGPFTAVDWEERFQQMQGFYAIIAGQLLPDVTQILGMLTAEQQEALFSNLRKKRQEDWKKYVEPAAEKVNAERARRMEQRLQRWLGRLHAEQRLAIQRWSEDLGNTAEGWLTNRDHWQEQFRNALLRTDQDRGQLQQAMEHLLLRPEALWEPDYRAQTERSLQRTIQLLLEIESLTTATQRQALHQRLARYSRDIARVDCTWFARNRSLFVEETDEG
jgi:hypothetical protein